MNTTNEKTSPRSIATIAREIAKLWGAKTHYSARPYLEAMYQLNSLSDAYGQDTARDIVIRFLGNAATFRGPDARRLKAELKALFGLK